MTTLTLDAILKMKPTELSKTSKKDVIEAISTSGFQYINAIKEKKDAIEASKKQDAESLAAKRTLAGYVGYEFSEYQKDYHGEVKWEKVSISELVGLALLKSARY